ncbi:MAG: NepR family anti-sigma factor [Methylocystis sp.]|uniref:NepR family anti-sigma factor n=1 Tax=Methylocystis sp. TaxID=1911079 RepID=UPI003D0EF201
MSPQDNLAIWKEPTLGTRSARDPRALEASVRLLGEQLRRQFCEVASEPLPDDMRALLDELEAGCAEVDGD